MCTDKIAWPTWALAPDYRAEILVPEHDWCSKDWRGRAGPVQQLPAGKPPFSKGWRLQGAAQHQ